MNKPIEEMSTEADTVTDRVARRHKAQVSVLLDEIVVAMEDARKDGFHIQFSIAQDGDGRNVVAPGSLVIMKRW